MKRAINHLQDVHKKPNKRLLLGYTPRKSSEMARARWRERDGESEMARARARWRERDGESEMARARWREPDGESQMAR